MPAIKTSSPEETARLGEKLASLLRSGDVICLNGELGAGKTRFAQGVGRGLGVSDPVTSPTFTLINEYGGRLPFYHMDVYRLDGPAGLEDLGYEEYFYGCGVTLVEWAGQVEAFLPEERLDIVINSLPDDEDFREIVLAPRGARYRCMVEELMDIVCAGD